MNREGLYNILNSFDYSTAIIKRVSGKQVQLGNIAVNKQLWEEFNNKYPGIFKDKSSFMRFLVDRLDFDLHKIIENSFCPICDKFTHEFSMKNEKRHCCCKKHQSEYTLKMYKQKTGFDSPWSNPQVVTKRRLNFQEKYDGASTPMEVEEFKNKCFESNKNNHGGVLACRVKSIKEKTMKTNKENHDGVFNLLLPDSKEKLKQVCQEKFGTDNPLQCKEVRDRVIETHGGIGAASPIIRAKIIATHGSDPIKDPVIIQKVKETMNRNYGGFSEALKTEKVRSKIRNTMMERYGVEYYVLSDECNSKNVKKVSKTNLKFAEKLKELGHEVEFEKVIGNRSFDIFIPKVNTVIEINPSYTHNSSSGSVFGKPVDPSYHLNKKQLSEKHGIRCIHVWDWDDIDKIISLFVLKREIYARKCEVKEVSQKETNEFLDNYHLQGRLRVRSINVGLYKDDELVQLMTFGKPRYNKKYQWELLRLCTKPEYIVTGGSKKLFKYFCRKYAPESVISYCDYSKFTGDVYEKLGFTLKNRNFPSAHWSKGKQHITDNQLRKLGADKLIGTNYGKGTNNEEIMISEGWLKVYDCGQITYLWER